MGVELPRPALSQPFPALPVPPKPCHLHTCHLGLELEGEGASSLYAAREGAGAPDFPRSTLTVQNPCPETDAGFLSRLSFWWFTK